MGNSGWRSGGQRERSSGRGPHPVDRRAAARLAAAHPLRECRAAHLPGAAQAIRQRAGSARRIAWSRAPGRCQRLGPHLCAGGGRARDQGGTVGGRELGGAGRARLSVAPADDRRSPAAHRGARTSAGPRPPHDRRGRGPQCLGGRHQARRPARARPRRSRSGGRVRARARHRRRRPSGDARDRHRRGAGRRPQPHLSAREPGARRPPSWRKARRCRKCRSTGSRAPTTSRAATA